MTYLPHDYINSNYKYQLNNDYFRVITNENCYTNYNNTYCDCFNVYPKLDYLASEITSCNINVSNYVNSSSFTDNFYYRIDFTNILIMFTIMSIFIIYLPIKIFSKIFRKGVL